MNTIEAVREYHQKMGINIAPDINISNMPLNRFKLRRIGAEMFKLNHSLEAEDVAGALEYLINVQIELDSAMLSLGFAEYKEAAFNAIHQANMTKLDDNGNPVLMGDGQIAETKNFQPPQIFSLIEQVKQTKG